MVAQLVRLVQILHGGAVRRQLALGQRQHTNDAIHRGADFVRRTREEGRLGLAGLLGLLQALFEFFNLLVQGGAAAQGGRIHRIAFAAADIHIDPLAVFHMQLIGQLLCAVPRRIAFPEGAARGGVCQLGQQRRHVPPANPPAGCPAGPPYRRPRKPAAYPCGVSAGAPRPGCGSVPLPSARPRRQAPAGCGVPSGAHAWPRPPALRTGHPCIFQARCRSGVGGANNFGGIVLSLTPKRHVGAEFSRRVAHPAASRHQIWGFAKNFCRCVVINSTIEKPLRRGGGVHTGGLTPLLYSLLQRPWRHRRRRCRHRRRCPPPGHR